MNRVVPLRLDIAPDESLTGYLARLAEHNAYDRSTWIVLEAGEKSLNMTSWRAESLPALSQLIGLPLDVVVERTYLNNGGQCNFFGQWVPRALLDCVDQKFCPDCLREHGYHSALFDLAPVWACLLHQRRLSKLCPACGTPIYWGAPGLLACPNCRADLRRAKTDHLHPNTLTGLVALARRAGFTHHHSAIPADGAMPLSLSHLSLGEFIELLLGFASYSGHLDSNGSFLNVLSRSRNELHLALRSGWNVLRQWPSSFHDFLRRMSSGRRAHVYGAYGLNRDFGSFVIFLMHQQREPWLTVKKVFRQYLTNEWDGDAIPRRDSALGDFAIPFKRISMTEVRRRLGRCQPKIVALMNAKILRHRRSGTSRGRPIFFDREDIDKIAPPGSPPLNLKDMAKRLEIATSTAKRLIEAEVIRAVSGPAIDQSNTYMILVGEIEALLNSLASHALKTSRCRTRSRNLSSILKAQKMLRLPLKPIMDALVGGRVRPTKKKIRISGLRAFEYDHNDVKTLFDDVESRSMPNGGLPLSVVAKRLGIQRASVFWLIGRGHLRRCDKSRMHLARILTTSLEAFEAKWVKVGVLAAELATSRALVIRALMAEGLKPIEGARVDRYGVFYFQRRQVESVDLQKAIRNAALLKGKGRPAYQREYRRRQVG